MAVHRVDLKADVKISILKTNPYSEHELANMSIEKYANVKHYDYEKVIAEETVIDQIFEGIDQLKSRVLEVCEEYSPVPIIVKTNAFRNFFITRMLYDSRDSNGVFEMILYHLDDDTFSKEIEVGQIEERIKEFRNHLIENRSLTDKEKALVDVIKQQISHNPHPTLHPMIAELAAFLYLRNSDNDFSLKQKTHDSGKNHVRAPMKAGSPRYLMEDKAIILCRIIGKNWNNVCKFAHYYKEFHSVKKPVYDLDNIIHQLSHARISKTP